METEYSRKESLRTDGGTPDPLRYVLITPARNEAEFIEQTIHSVLSQTVRPAKWIIVNDGSSDGTEEIIRRYAATYDWIELVSRPPRMERHFAGKARAFAAGYENVIGLDYDVIGNLDADITFDKDYLAFLLARFAENAKLGVAGTPFREESQQYNYHFTSIQHVSGACQLFRRKCFEQIGGYTPIKIGGIDLIAVISARMEGWETRCFLEKTSIHHRKMGTAKQSRLMVAFRGGRGDYLLGTHLLWEFSRTFYQMTKPPVIVGGLARLAGFSWALATRKEKLVPLKFVEFRRAEQMHRLQNYLTRLLMRKETINERAQSA